MYRNSCSSSVEDQSRPCTSLLSVVSLETIPDVCLRTAALLGYHDGAPASTGSMRGGAGERTAHGGGRHAGFPTRGRPMAARHPVSGGARRDRELSAGGAAPPCTCGCRPLGYRPESP